MLVANFVLLVAATLFVTRSTPTTNKKTAAQSALSASTETVNPLDELSSADIAVNIAKVTNLPEATSVNNLADTVNAQLAVASSSNTIIAKPQVIATGLKTRFDIQTYIVKKGDTLASIAKQFDISSETIRNANSLTGDNVKPGQKLIIAPIDGIIYTVKSGDTVDSIAARYSANRDEIIAFNDLESGRMPVGQKIVVPNGELPVRASGGGGGAIGLFSARYGYNGYDFGYCTWWAATRRAQIGRPIPSNLGNASSWLSLSRAAGFSTGKTPAKGAVIWTPPRDFYGHVGFVEDVLANGSVVVSEMNTVGWNRVSRKTLSPSEAARYSYIY